MTSVIQQEGGTVTAPTQGPAPVQAKAEAGTDYVVLSRDTDGSWDVVKTVNARTPENAIKDAHGDDNGARATYVAVSARSWKPMHVMPKVETTLVIEAAK